MQSLIKYWFIFNFRMKTRNNFNSPNIFPNVTYFTFYRQLQLLVIFINHCMQQMLWPTVQFCGAVAIIATGYAVIVFSSHMTTSMLAGLLSINIISAVFCTCKLEFGSMPRQISIKMINSWAQWGNIKYCKKFVKSCKPLSIQVGPFHIMDRNRAPALIRFCMQRTIFLVVQSRQS